MSGNTFLDINSSGQITQTAGTQLGGASYAGQIVALNSSGQIDPTMLSASSGSPQITATAGVAISAGQLVNLYNNSGTLTAKVADCSTGLPAMGFATAAIASGATGTIQLLGLNASLASLTPGTQLFLGTAGAVSSTPPTTSGYIVQPVGYAVSASEAEFQPSQFIVTLA